MKFKELFERISPRIRTIARKINRHFGFFDEDDLLQEALLYLWGEYKEGELCEKNDSYLVQGCVFFMKNYIRVACKSIDLSSTSMDTVINEETNDTLKDIMYVEDPKARFAFIMVDITIEDILGCLDPREKKVFLLSLKEMTTREIGKNLGLSHVMVVKLRKKIQKKCESIISEIKTSKGLPEE